MKDVFIIGSKGIPARYGGFETFVDNLTGGQQNDSIRYYVACMDDKDEVTEYQGAKCFHLKVPPIGPARAVYYDLRAFRWCLSYIQKNRIEQPVVYVLACRIGPFVGRLAAKLHRLGGTLFVNPDGHEWLRAKWNAAIRRYWKLSERLMVKHADLLVCDSKNIEQYIKDTYRRYQPETTYIAYGTETLPKTREGEEKLAEWYKQFGLKPQEYYLIVGRFVPENNYRTMLREFCRSNTARKLVLITNAEHNTFYKKLDEETHFSQDERICFAGTVYDAELLQRIRENAYGYFHGHEVGGTNPSLLEALSATDLNLLCDVNFNREVGGTAAWYWNKEDGNLAALIERADKTDAGERQRLGMQAKKRMQQNYSWKQIIGQYETLFCGR